MEEGHQKFATIKTVVRWCPFIVIVLTICFVRAHADPQFRAEQTGNFYEQPYNRPTTSRPGHGYPVPNYRQPDNYGVVYRDQSYRYPGGSYEYRGTEYSQDVRGAQRYGPRERDRLGLRYQQFDDPNNLHPELRNTIFDRWRPDLQGEQRPGETPGGYLA